MATNPKPKPPTPGFAIRISDETDLQFGLLVAEDDAECGGYLPIGVVGTIAEAREAAKLDLQIRRQDLEKGQTPFCPDSYKVWARGLGGEYRVAAEFDTTQL